MKDFFYGLLRYYLRINEVIIRIYDTRIYHSFDTNYIHREFIVFFNVYLFKELEVKDSYKNIK